MRDRSKVQIFPRQPILKGSHVSNMQELGEYLYGDPETAISDIKFSWRPEAKNSTPEELAAMILAALKDIRAGGGRPIDLSI
jgi:hypothetical protein